MDKFYYIVNLETSIPWKVTIKSEGLKWRASHRVGAAICTTYLTQDSSKDIKNSYKTIWKSRQPKRKVGKRPEQAFHNTGHPMANKHMKWNLKPRDTTMRHPNDQHFPGFLSVNISHSNKKDKYNLYAPVEFIQKEYIASLPFG